MLACPTMNSALLGAIVGGTIGIVAAVVGQAAYQVFRRYGKVRCFVPHARREPPYTSPRQPMNYAITFAFPLWFFNEKEVAIGITELLLTFHKGGQQLVLEYIKEKGSEEPIRTLDLPPRQWVYKDIEFECGIAVASLDPPPRDGAPETFEEMRLTWTYPSGKQETRMIPTLGQNEPRGQILRSYLRAFRRRP